MVINLKTYQVHFPKNDLFSRTLSNRFNNYRLKTMYKENTENKCKYNYLAA